MSNTLPAIAVPLPQWRENFLKIARFLLRVIKDAGAQGRRVGVGVPEVERASCRVCFGVGVVVGRRVLPAGVVGVSGSSSVGSAALGAGGSSVGRVLFVG